jgi:hypothetical protein
VRGLLDAYADFQHNQDCCLWQRWRASAGTTQRAAQARAQETLLRERERV